MKCSDLMTQDPACCLASETVQTAAQMMISENVGPIPVVDDHSTRKVIGIVTDRDIALRIVAEGRDPKSTRVEEIMSRDLISCRPGDDVRVAARLMEEHQVRRILVTNDNNQLQGIIAQADIATRGGSDQRTADVVEEISSSR